MNENFIILFNSKNNKLKEAVTKLLLNFGENTSIKTTNYRRI